MSLAVAGLIVGTLSVPAFAEDAPVVNDTTITETGALIESSLTALIAKIGKPLPVSRAAMLLAPAKMTAWASDVLRYNEKSLEYRTTCQESIRRANRDMILKQATTCFRGDLLLHTAYLRKQSTYVAALPFLQDSTRSGALLSIKKLMDAEMTIVNAIDTNLYTSVEILSDTKQKLREQYRLPYWLSLLQIQADRQLTFMSLMLKDVKEIVETGKKTPLLEKSILEALSCLDTSTDAFQGVFTATGSTAAWARLQQAQITLPDCKNAVWTVAHIQSRQGVTTDETTESQTDAKK